MHFCLFKYSKTENSALQNSPSPLMSSTLLFWVEGTWVQKGQGRLYITSDKQSYESMKHACLVWLRIYDASYCKGVGWLNLTCVTNMQMVHGYQPSNCLEVWTGDSRRGWGWGGCKGSLIQLLVSTNIDVHTLKIKKYLSALCEIM